MTDLVPRRYVEVEAKEKEAQAKAEKAGLPHSRRASNFGRSMSITSNDDDGEISIQMRGFDDDNFMDGVEARLSQR